MQFNLNDMPHELYMETINTEELPWAWWSVTANEIKFIGLPTDMTSPSTDSCFKPEWTSEDVITRKDGGQTLEDLAMDNV